VAKPLGSRKGDVMGKNLGEKGGPRGFSRSDDSSGSEGETEKQKRREKKRKMGKRENDEGCFWAHFKKNLAKQERRNWEATRKTGVLHHE